MIVRQFCARHGRTFVARSSSCQSASYATSISVDDRRLRPSTGDRSPQGRLPGHPDDASSILDTSPLPPTPRTRAVDEALDSSQSSVKSIQHEINTHVAARTGGITSDPNVLTHTIPSSTPSIKTKPIAALNQFNARQNALEQLGRAGTTVTDKYSPLTLLHDPPKPEDVTLPQLLANQTHMGHHTSLWNPANSSYIDGIRQGIHIISLDITYAYLTRAAKVVREVAHRGGLILFIGTRKGHEDIIVRAAARAQGYHVFDRWVPGTLTNGQQLLGKCGVKIVDGQDNELESFREMLDKGKHSVIKPDLVVCMNPLENEVCLHECGLNDVPTIGVIDTDANPAWVTYPIPANDDSLRSVGLIAGVLSQAAKQGQQARLAAAEEGRLTYRTDAVKRWLAHTEELSVLDVDEAGAKEDEAAAKAAADKS